ncbi:hypothetical protein ASA1KI_38370 [Opitutales bacterium ASA1]|uniref:hypothetical protein n=1 Tax=Congregicoccus parvus TaxID=3081749 RepID=UPI002B30BA02|nr:hypothetical protein ASA1KI_38370 [Opitutales bacterium ASA1]
MKKRRESSTSLSFLDCICCGFGAIILLFILSMGATTQTIRKSKSELDRILQERLAALGTLKAQKESLSGELNVAETALEQILKEIATLEALIATLSEQIQNESSGQEELITKIKSLQQEVAVMQTETELPQLDATTPIGVPVESNYVAFVIDTSGSMRDPRTDMLWDYVFRKFDEVIRAYPEVKGIQFLDADGRFILGRASGWLDDSPSTRQAILQAVRRYQIFSNSNPVPGIVRAVRTLHDPSNPDMRMGVYVFGDEFTETAESVLDRLDRLNPPGEDGKRPITINGVGFPNLLRSGFSLGQSGLKFANLMRELTNRHGGAFIAVTD